MFLPSALHTLDITWLFSNGPHSKQPRPDCFRPHLASVASNVRCDSLDAWTMTIVTNDYRPLYTLIHTASSCTTRDVRNDVLNKHEQTTYQLVLMVFRSNSHYMKYADDIHIILFNVHTFFIIFSMLVEFLAPSPSSIGRTCLSETIAWRFGFTSFTCLSIYEASHCDLKDQDHCLCMSLSLSPRYQWLLESASPFFRKRYQTTGDC